MKSRSKKKKSYLYMRVLPIISIIRDTIVKNSYTYNYLRPTSFI